MNKQSINRIAKQIKKRIKFKLDLD